MNPLEEQLVAYYYGEADDPAAVEKLLADDPTARQLYEELSAVLAELRPAEPPERSEDYPSRVWEKLQWRLGEPRLHFRWWEFLTMRQLAPAMLLAENVDQARLLRPAVMSLGCRNANLGVERHRPNQFGAPVLDSQPEQERRHGREFKRLGALDSKA